MFQAIITAIVFFLGAILAAYACHAAPTSPSGTMPEIVWGAIAFVCLAGGIMGPIAIIADEAERNGRP